MTAQTGFDYSVDYTSYLLEEAPAADESVEEAPKLKGFELIDDKKSQTVELIKDAIIELVHYDDNGLKTNLSDYLASKLHRDYSALSKLFSETTNTTIEKYLIAQKIERDQRTADVRGAIPGTK